jgi:hypothetical protein
MEMPAYRSRAAGQVRLREQPGQGDLPPELQTVVRPAREQQLLVELEQLEVD